MIAIPFEYKDSLEIPGHSLDFGIAMLEVEPFGLKSVGRIRPGCLQNKGHSSLRVNRLGQGEADQESFEDHAGVERAAALEVEIGALEGCRKLVDAGGAEMGVLFSGLLDGERRNSGEPAGFIDVQPCRPQSARRGGA